MKQRKFKKSLLAAGTVLMILLCYFSVLASNTAMIPVPTICQYPNLPTGCESVAATMVLQYYHVNIPACQFAKDWLECGDFYTVGNKLYGPDPHAVFVGNPFTKHSYGCYADVIVNAVNRHCSQCAAEKIADQSLDALCRRYIDHAEPLLIWATMGMKPSRRGNRWYLPDESLFTWTAGEHCLVLVGYDAHRFFLNDPQTGTTVAYPRQLVARRFQELGTQAVRIYKTSG